MVISGIICECNPFHMGHARIIRHARAHSDGVVCLMSQSFVQRGEPAMHDFAHRVKWALLAGADLVIALPTIYSLQSAEGFAAGGVNLLADIGIDSLVFGCELDDAHWLTQIARLRNHEPKPFQEALQEALSAGLSHGAALEAASRACLPGLPKEALLPNGILAIEYIRANLKQKKPMKICPIKREGPVSATTIRKALSEGLMPQGLPAYVEADLPLPMAALEDLSQAILYALRSRGPEDFSLLPQAGEGLEQRLWQAARKAANFDELLALAATRRYPLSRIKRLLCSALLNITKTDAIALQKPCHARIAGLSPAGGNIIKTLQGRSRLPLIQKAVALKDDPSFAIDCRAADIRALANDGPSGQTFTDGVITI